MHNSFCIAPWVQMFIEPTGNVKPCDVWKNGDYFGNVNTASIHDIAISPKMNSARSRMLSGECLEECNHCNVSDTNDINNFKTKYNTFFARHIPDIVSNTTADGKLLKPFKLRRLHNSTSNMCNMTCKMCSGNLSSKIEGKVIQITPESKSDILNNLEHLETITLSGGESLLSETTYEILNKLIELDKTDILTYLVTNMSISTYKGVDILEFLKQFPNLCIIASIDSEGERFSYIRGFKNWDLVKTNLLNLHRSGINYRIIPTVTLYNILSIANSVGKISLELGIPISKFELKPLINPEQLSVSTLPQTIKTKINKLYSDNRQFDEVLHIMNTRDTSNLFGQFLNSLDAEALTAIPELRGYYEYRQD